MILQARLKSRGDPTDLVGSSAEEPPTIARLEGTSVFRAILTLSLARTSGLIGITSGEETIGLRLSKGKLLHASSDLYSDDEQLLVTLCERASVGPTDLQKVVANCEEKGASLARTLAVTKALDVPHIARALQDAYLDHLRRALSFETADLIVGPPVVIGEVGARDPFEIDLRGPLAMWMREQLRRWYWTHLETLLAPLMPRWLRIDEEKKELLEALQLSKREEHPLKHLFAGEYRFDEAIGVSILSKNDTARLVLLLSTFGVLELLAEAPLVLGPAAIGGLKRTAKRIAGCDRFAAVDSHWSTHPDDITANHERLLARYGPTSRYHEDPDTSVLAKRIMVMVDAGWEGIRERKRRVAYRGELVGEEQRRLSSDLILSQGMAAEYRNERKRAIQLFQMADEIYANQEAREALGRLRPSFGRG